MEKLIDADESMFSHLLFDCVLLMLLLLTSSLKGAYVSQVGQNADLPCTYSPATTENLVPVCWGKGPCPVFECYSLVLRTDGRNVTYQTSSRYLLKRDLHKGDVTLTIKNVTLADSGTYCCRIQFPGLMNDRKSNLELIIKPAKVTPAWTPWRDITTAFPRMLTTKGPVSETRTLKTLHDKNQTEISTLATELQDMGATTRTGLYIGAGVFAGLALILISGGLILKFSGTYHHLYQGFTQSRMLTLVLHLADSFSSFRTEFKIILVYVSVHSILLIHLCSPLPFGNHKFVFCVCESVSVL
uniref:Hepatitis A virus cellular receptor 2 n=1 Tax=Bos indicus x Bos taurus TaxID=30522 RepID=A0A4W2GP69_BOBOX